MSFVKARAKKDKLFDSDVTDLVFNSRHDFLKVISESRAPPYLRMERGGLRINPKLNRVERCRYIAL